MLKQYTTLIVIIIAFPIGAYQKQSIEFSPKKFHVGERIIVAVTVLLNSGEDISGEPLFSQGESFLIHDISAKRDNNMGYISITFSSYRIGEQLLPAIRIGNVLLDDISFEVTARLSDGEKELSPVRAALNAPGYEFFFIVLLCVCIFLPVVAYRMFKKLPDFKNVISNYIKRRRPYRRLSRELSFLDTYLAERDVKDFFSHLSVALRSYLSNRTSILFSSKTTTEIKRLPPLIREVDLWEELVNILLLCDAVRFAEKSVSEDERSLTIKSARVIVDRIEKEVAHV